MTAPLDALLAAREAIDTAIAAVGGGNVTPANDDPLTAPLGPYGEWQPSWLRAKAAAAASRYPNGFGTSESIGVDGRPGLSQFAWPSHFIWGGCLARTDLTEQQRKMIQFADQQGFGQGILNAAADTPAWQALVAVNNGPWTALLNGTQIHADLANLREETERYFARYLGV
jgi:hypothetical protein